MRVVVIREFIDKNTSVCHEIGEKLTVTEERFAELQKSGKYVIDITDEIGQQEKPVVPEDEQEIDQEQETDQEPEEKAPKGRRNRKKAESEDK